MSPARQVIPTLPLEPVVTFSHIERLTNNRAMFEHANGTQRRTEHGYCTDDNARLLVVASRERGDVALRFSTLALNVLLSAQSSEGKFCNRLSLTGGWTDKPSTEDCWGRAIWGLGVAAAGNENASIRERAFAALDLAISQRSVYSRAMAFAALGVADAYVVRPTPAARRFLVDAIAVIDPVGSLTASVNPSWVWPEPRLRYANATLAEALLAAATALHAEPDSEDREDREDREDGVNSEHAERTGLAMLRWLLAEESPNGHLSVVGSAGRDIISTTPQFDQQPIEVAAMADACARAASITGDPHWETGVTLAVDWFRGANDVGLVMFDAESGGGYDGLHADRVNLNQGAESTLAYVSTMQQARLQSDRRVTEPAA
jgi:hypothetical protein